MLAVAIAARRSVQATSLVVSPAGPYRTLGRPRWRPRRRAQRSRARRHVSRADDHRSSGPSRCSGEPGAILDGEGTHGIIIVHADHVTIRGLEFTNTGMLLQGRPRGAARRRRGGLPDRAATGSSATFFAIYLARSTDCVVSRQCHRGRADGAKRRRGTGSISGRRGTSMVGGNRISGHRDGIYLEFTRHADVRDNTQRAERPVRHALHVLRFVGVHPQHLPLQRQRRRGDVHQGRDDDRAITFASNHGAASYGLLLKEIQDARLDGNIFRGNTVGLLADGADRAVVTGNQFKDNGWALRLLGSTVDGPFHRQRLPPQFVRRGRQRQWRTSTVFTGNWWDSYHGWDLDHDGIGDVPYHPVRLFALLVEHAQPALLLQRSLFVKLLDAAERALAGAHADQRGGCAAADAATRREASDDRHARRRQALRQARPCSGRSTRTIVTRPDHRARRPERRGQDDACSSCCLAWRAPTPATIAIAGRVLDGIDRRIAPPSGTCRRWRASRRT